MESLDLNFINVLRTAFTLADPKSIKKEYQVFTLSGSTSVKAARQTLVKLMVDLYVSTFWNNTLCNLYFVNRYRCATKEDHFLFLPFLSWLER